MKKILLSLLSVCLLSTSLLSQESDVTNAQLISSLQRAGNNRCEIEKALKLAPEEQVDGLRFLLAYMPTHDLQSLSAPFLLDNLQWAYQAKNVVPWGHQIPTDLFLNDVLPYAAINERRDNWRQDFFERFFPLVENCRTPGEAAQILNRDIFKILNVQYHARKRPKPDQSPYESIEASYASCTGLSILLIDACRALCIPARFAGTPQWADKRGNHSWVEVWDQNTWNFTGACEYSPEGLNHGWFTGDASKALKDNPLHAIYASSWKTTGTAFPLIWNRSIQYVPAVNVTERYTQPVTTQKQIDATQATVSIQIFTRPGGPRIACPIIIRQNNQEVARAKTMGPQNDTNHWLDVPLKKNASYEILYRHPDATESKIQTFQTTDQDSLLLELYLEPNQTSALEEFKAYVAQPRASRSPLEKQPFASIPLNQEQALSLHHWLWEQYATSARAERQEEIQNKSITLQDHTLRYDYKIFGEAPAGGHSLFISLHGGGNTRKEVNDRQWENQKNLYQPEEGVYLAPRAPTDTWNLWHQAHIDPLFDRLIQNLILSENINPNRVYVMGYSAGGDGVYQLAPRMADRWAAAAMMAGHPNETSPLGLRNIGFALHMGGNDSAYKRNEVAAQWKNALQDLQQADPEGYAHQVVIHEGKGHWMEKQDAIAVPWMAQFTRNPFPKRIVWKQDDVTHPRFYWLAVSPEHQVPGSLITARIEGQNIHLQSSDLQQVTLLLNDSLLDLNQPITVRFNEKTVYQGKPVRTPQAVLQNFEEHPDPATPYSVRLTVQSDT